MTEPTEEARMLATLAGITLAVERQADLAAGLSGTRRIAESLTHIDLSRHQPAAQFRAPPPSHK